MAARDTATSRVLHPRPASSMDARSLPADSVEALAAALAPHLAHQLADLAAPGLASSLLNAEQAGALLSVPATWVLAEARAGRIPHIRLGHYVRFETRELEQWWRDRARGPRRGRT